MTAGSVSVTIQYDADSNRVAKTVNGVTTRYLVDDLNPTGYAQVVEEVTAGAVTRQYTYGLQRISQTQQIANTWTTSFYGYDGGGTVRLLTDSTGTVTDTYDYDAWGNTVNTTGPTPNVYQYRGEQYDSDLMLYYLRARYFNPIAGRFLERDQYPGRIMDPTTQHRYLYADSDPINRSDPSGLAAAPVPRPPFEVIEGGRTADEYTTLLSTILLPVVVGGCLAQVGDRDACVWYEALDRLAVAAVKVALDTGGSYSPDTSQGVKQAGKRDCQLPWKCLIKCYVMQNGAVIGDKGNWYLAEGLTVDEDVESVCRRAEDSARQSVRDIPGRAIKHCNRKPGGTRIVWRRPEDAPRIVDGVPQ
jgi:RHS repeat-associated protein